ncbi:MAG: hypothetical protein ACREV8_11370, partial [Gammaproteobacteria bacterium]
MCLPAGNRAQARLHCLHMSTGFIYDPVYLEHDTGHGHPECRRRLEVSMAHLAAQPWFERIPRIAARPA